MSFSRREPSNRRKVYLNLSDSIESQLRDAYAKRHEARAETQISVGNKLGVGRSVVNRRLLGRTNMTIETLSDMVWALGQCIKVDIFNPYDKPSNEPRIISEHALRLDGAMVSATSTTTARIQFDASA